MASATTTRFMEALQHAEQTGDVERLVELFGDEAELRNLSGGPERGRDGARRFWSDYLKVFDSVRSTFHHVVEADGTAALEWVSDATMPDGTALRYPGISVLELRGDRVAKFRTYYDSAAFVTPATESRATGGAGDGGDSGATHGTTSPEQAIAEGAARTGYS